MNVLIAILFSAVVVSAYPQGWGAPSPSIDLELSGAVALTGSGSGSAGQALQENVSGDPNVPASVVSLNGVAVGVEQNGDVVQIANADLSGESPVTSTIQGVSGANDAVALDTVQAQLQGANSVVVSNSAATAVDGSGTIDATASSLNSVITKRN